MKRIMILASVFAMMMAGEASAQNFLNRMKQKAEEAVQQRVENITGRGNSNGKQDGPKIDISDDDNTNNIRLTTRIVEDYKPERGSVSVNSAYVDEDNIKPASGKTFQELISKLPQLPSADQLANPTDAFRSDYYSKIAAVRIRAEQLLEEEGCSGIAVDYNAPQISQTDAAAMQQEAMKRMEAMQKCFGSEKEMADFEKEMMNLEKEVEKAGKARGRKLSDLEVQLYTRDNHNKLFKKTLQINEAMNGINAAAMEAFVAVWEKETKAKGRELTKAEQLQLAEQTNPTLAKQMKAAEAKVSSMTDYADKQREKADRQKELSAKLDAISRDNGAALNECNKYAEKYEGQLRDIYRKIIGSSDRNQVNQLYAQADGMVKDYRTNAAKIWIDNLSKHISEVKSAQPQLEAAAKEMNAGSPIEACSADMMSWRCVLKIANDLEDAFADFPEISVSPVQVSETNIQCYRYESVFYPLVTGFESKSKFSGSGNDDLTKQYESTKAKPAYGTYKSPDGKRVAVFSSDGSLTLPDGSIHYPVAFEKQGDLLVWYEVAFDGLSTVMEYKYKL